MARLRGDKWVQYAFNGAIIVLVGAVLIALLVMPVSLGQLQLRAGEVAPRNIVVPHKITYESAVKTQRARERAEQAVPDYYDPPQSRIRRQQVTRSHEVLDYITDVRNDPLADPEGQVEDLIEIGDFSLSQTMAEQILELTPEEWQLVANEVPVVLDQVMREEIRENALPAARRRIPVLVSPDLDDEVTLVVIELVRGLVRPNSFVNPERTEELRLQAWESIPVQTQTLEQGEVLLRAGDIVTEEDVEALEQLGLSQAEWNWWLFFQAILISALLVALVVGTLYRLRPRILMSRRESGLLLLLSIIGLLVGRLMVVPHDWLPYLFPLAALCMLAVLLLDIQVAVALVLPFALFIGYLSNGNVTLIFYSSIGALIGALVVGKADRLTAFLWAGLAVMMSNLLIMIAFWTQPLELTTTSQVMRVLFVALLNGGLAASIALIGYLTLGNLFSITTSLQLMELSRPTHPLLRQLLLKAPGTYHHTILVSNLAERAAEAINADAFLIRVGAYYHDIGKIVRPYFFTENIGDESSPHAGLDAKTSAQIIISHVKDGADLARKYRLPSTIQDLIWQHHGAQVMEYFYRQALESADGDAVDIEDFRYPGPDPQTKEAAIMMLADICEAAVRAERPASRQDLETMVDRLIMQRVLDGSLNRSELTFKDLQTVKQIFVQVLQGVHHPRIKYPTRIEDGTQQKVVVPPDTATLPMPVDGQEEAEKPVAIGEKTGNGRDKHSVTRVVRERQVGER
jgi:cyclic-di-AMP phosphodiesterase PgpH